MAWPRCRITSFVEGGLTPSFRSADSSFTLSSVSLSLRRGVGFLRRSSGSSRKAEVFLTRQAKHPCAPRRPMTARVSSRTPHNGTPTRSSPDRQTSGRAGYTRATRVRDARYKSSTAPTTVARGRCSGGIDGRPLVEYDSSKRLDSASSSASVIAGVATDDPSGCALAEFRTDRTEKGRAVVRLSQVTLSCIFQ